VNRVSYLFTKHGLSEQSQERPIVHGTVFQLARSVAFNAMSGYLIAQEFVVRRLGLGVPVR